MTPDRATITVKTGISPAGIATGALVVLKLCGAIGWPWLWVVAPLWTLQAAVEALGVLGLVATSIGRFLQRRRRSPATPPSP